MSVPSGQSEIVQHIEIESEETFPKRGEFDTHFKIRINLFI